MRMTRIKCCGYNYICHKLNDDDGCWGNGDNKEEGDGCRGKDGNEEEQVIHVSCGSNNATAELAMFYLEEQEHTDHHLDHGSGKARYCKQCGVKYMEVMGNKIIGCLPESLSMEYANLKKNDTNCENLFKNGYTILELDEAGSLTATLLSDAVYNELSSSKKVQMKPRQSCIPTKNRNTGRKWAQLYHLTRAHPMSRRRGLESDTRKNDPTSLSSMSVMALAENFQNTLIRTIFPDEHYATLASTCKKHLDSNYEDGLQMFDLMSIVCLSRDNKTLERQCPHIDSRDGNINVSLPYLCGGKGYSLFFVPGTHLLKEHKQEMVVPHKALEEVSLDARNGGQVKKVLVYFDNVIHSGGACTMSKEEHSEFWENKQPNEWPIRRWGKPTDVTFQLKLLNNNLQSGVNADMESVIWYKDEKEQPACTKSFEGYIEDNTKEWEDLKKEFFNKWVETCGKGVPPINQTATTTHIRGGSQKRRRTSKL